MVYELMKLLFIACIIALMKKIENIPAGYSSGSSIWKHLKAFGSDIIALYDLRPL